MIKSRRAIYILLLLAALLMLMTVLAFVLDPLPVKERPTLVYFYFGQ